MPSETCKRHVDRRLRAALVWVVAMTMAHAPGVATDTAPVTRTPAAQRSGFILAGQSKADEADSIAGLLIPRRVRLIIRYSRTAYA